MTRQLVHQNFRYANGQVADNEDVLIVGRGTILPVILYAAASGGTALPNPIFTDETGNISFYIDSGSYDYLINEARIPFDVSVIASIDSLIYIDPVSTTGLPDGTLIARTT